MSTFWAVVKREAAERYMLLFGASILGFLPFAASLLSDTTGIDTASDRLALATILALISTGVAAVLLGGSVIARDLAERRLSFYFARPIPSSIIWGGKMTAAVVLSLASGALILVPAALGGLGELAPELNSWLLPAVAVAVGIPGAVGLAHALGVLLRNRSPWLLLDFAGLSLVSWIVLEARAPLVQAGIAVGSEARLSILTQGLFVLTAFLVAAILGAGALQVAKGRTDLRRGHRLFSSTFWSAALAAALLFAGFSRWVIAVEPGDLRQLEAVVAAPAGPWVLAAGEALGRPGFFPLFLLDTSNGRSVRIDVGAHLVGGTLRIAGGYALVDSYSPFSDDGSHAQWLEPQRGGGYRVLQLDLTRPGSQPSSTPVTFADIPLRAALSPEGSRLATLDADGRRLLVQDLRRGAILASENPPAYGGRLRFEGRDRVLLEQSDSAGGCLLLEIDLLSRNSHRQTCNDRKRPRNSSPFNPVWDSFVIQAGDRIVWDAPGLNGANLFVQRYDDDPEHGPVQEILIPGAVRLKPGGQLSESRLAVQSLRKGRSTATSQIFAVDLDTGEKRLLGTGLGSVSGAADAAPGSPATRLFYSEKKLVSLDPDSGRQTVILHLSSEIPEETP